jgi:hypothetical protein
LNGGCIQEGYQPTYKTCHAIIVNSIEIYGLKGQRGDITSTPARIHKAILSHFELSFGDNTLKTKLLTPTFGIFLEHSIHKNESEFKITVYL